MSKHPTDGLIAAYLDTTYRYFGPDGVSVDLRIGQTSEPLVGLMAERGVDSAVFITAWNPRSQEVGAADNVLAQARLREALSGADLVLEGEGRGSDDAWAPEESLLALGVDFAEAGRLAEQFQQTAVVFVGGDGVPRLVVGFAN